MIRETPSQSVGSTIESGTVSFRPSRYDGGGTGSGPSASVDEHVTALEPLPERQMLSAIKSATGISVAILEKQVSELRRRLNATEDVHRQLFRPRWASQLRLDPAGTPERNEANVLIALSNDEAFAGSLVFDEFRQEILVVRALPWDQSAVLPRPCLDVDDVRCAVWLQHREINVSPFTVSRAVNAVAREIRMHPVRDYLTRVVWDGTSRLEMRKTLRSFERSAHDG